ncbi:MAG: nucleotide sugar dehydrogenase, partial [Alistipes sp.]|nr:nucleotide sugar dehydrogenase [Alistipes sp.]
MKKETIAIIGLGYVGFPLACLFARRHKVIGFDRNERRIAEIRQGIDSTGEVSEEKIRAALDAGMECTADKQRLGACRVFIIAVPTPIDRHRNPELSPLEQASRTVGEALSPGDTVIYESTVYPGVTEEFCVPLLEESSGLRFNEDFFVGYSPERINPGDRERTVENICKVTSGSTPEAAEYVDSLYRSVLRGGTHRAPSIRVAEAAKIIENSQRDVNIAFMNEIAKILHALGIDTHEVLLAAGTKWNFLPFTPGLVGGHCIGVDHYYLIQRAELDGIRPRLMTEARRIND